MMGPTGCPKRWQEITTLRRELGQKITVLIRYAAVISLRDEHIQANSRC